MENKRLKGRSLTGELSREKTDSIPQPLHTIRIKHGVTAHHCEYFMTGLRYEEAIERIAVNSFNFFNSNNVLNLYVEQMYSIIHDQSVYESRRWKWEFELADGLLRSRP